jgi:hypothetical protein
VYFYATYPTTDISNVWHLLSLLAVTIPAVQGSLTLAGNIAYIWRSRPHAAFRTVLLIANGFWLSMYAIGAALSVYLLAKHDDYPATEAIVTRVVCFFILAGNIAYIWRSRPHAHNEKGTSASPARSESMTSAQP